jgi:transmembrane sensor
VADHTIYKKKSWYLSTWVRYAAVVAVVVASGLFFITDWFRADSPDGIDMMAYNEPTLLLEGGDEIDLSGQSFTMKRDQALIERCGQLALL